MPRQKSPFMASMLFITQMAKWPRSCAAVAGRVDLILSQVMNTKNGACGLSSLILGYSGWLQRKASCMVLPLACHQCSIRCESSHIFHGRKYAEISIHMSHTTFKREDKANVMELLYNEVFSVLSRHST